MIATARDDSYPLRRIGALRAVVEAIRRVPRLVGAGPAKDFSARGPGTKAIGKAFIAFAGDAAGGVLVAGAWREGVVCGEGAVRVIA